MGLFDKKICDNCGAKIGLLGKRKLEDGIICKDCAAKLSPWFSERKQSTLAEIQEQLRYREQNQQVLASINPAVKLGGLRSGDYAVYIDNSKGKFFVTSSSNYQAANPDVIDLSQIISCQCEPSESRTEITFEGPDGEEQSYTPPRYEFEYVFWIKINVNTPYFTEMKFRLNSSRVDAGTPEFMTYQNLANQICAALGGSGMSANVGGMNAGMNMGGMQGMNNMGMQGGMNMGGMQGMNNMGMNAGMAGMAGMAGGMMNNGMNMGGMNAGMNNMGMQGGMMNNGMNNMGMQGGMMNQQGMGMAAGRTGGQYGAPGMKIKCSSCGWEPEDPSVTPKFCPNCGDRFDNNDIG